MTSTRVLTTLPLLLGGACASAPPLHAAPAPEAPAGVAIVRAGDPVLRARAEELDPARIGTPELQELFARMIETMRAAPGVGLAAPQIGVPWRVIVLEDGPARMAQLTAEEIAERERVTFGPRVIVNPVLTPIGEERARFFEGCLSVPGYVAVVERALEVEVEGLDEHGDPVSWRVRGWPARILQHEVDHLDGTLYVDRMSSRSLAASEEARARYAGRPMQEILQRIEAPRDAPTPPR
ncbi:MAG: peptide deformylase [Sandaracinaceae bacterium]|nr:peptide deformylase [Sandaracinaceae bacterium]